MTAETPGRTYRSAEERRTDIQANAARLGIDEAFVSRLVETFYHRIRADRRIAYLFENTIQDWDPHLATMKRFWRSVALNSGEYSGKPVPKHQAIAGTRPEHFDVWLEIFEQTLQETAPSKAATDYFMVRARRIAQSLELAVFGMTIQPPKDRVTGKPND